MTTFDDRECPHPKCAVTIPSTRFACTHHWRTLPAEIKSGINAAWRKVLHPGGMDKLTEAQQRAIDWWANRG